jgi:hypothetical protein
MRILRTIPGLENAHLLAMFHLGLESDHVEQRAELVVLTQLHDGIGFFRRLVRIGEAERLERSMPQGFAAALGHDLDRQTTIEIRRVRFPFVERDFFGGEQRVDESVILRAVERTIDVIGAGAAGARLVVTRLRPGDLHVDGFAMHDRRDGVEKRERCLAAAIADRFRQRGRGEGAGRDDHAVPFGGREPYDLAAFDRNQRMSFEAFGDGGGKVVAVHRQSAAGRHLMRIGRAHDQRAETPHLGMQQTNRIGPGIVRAEGVGADQFGKPAGFVRGRFAYGAHFMQHHRHAASGDLPGGLGAGEPAADNMDRGEIVSGSGCHRN